MAPLVILVYLPYHLEFQKNFVVARLVTMMMAKIISAKIAKFGDAKPAYSLLMRLTTALSVRHALTVGISRRTNVCATQPIVPLLKPA
jgi:hypothetical protein